MPFPLWPFSLTLLALSLFQSIFSPLTLSPILEPLCSITFHPLHPPLQPFHYPLSYSPVSTHLFPFYFSLPVLFLSYAGAAFPSIRKSPPFLPFPSRFSPALHALSLNHPLKTFPTFLPVPSSSPS